MSSLGSLYGNMLGNASTSYQNATDGYSGMYGSDGAGFSGAGVGGGAGAGGTIPGGAPILGGAGGSGLGNIGAAQNLGMMYQLMSNAASPQTPKAPAAVAPTSPAPGSIIASTPWNGSYGSYETQPTAAQQATINAGTPPPGGSLTMSPAQSSALHNAGY